MDQGPRVSVVIPTYDSARYLALTLESILSQTMSDFELVIYDDGSSDDTLKIVEAHARTDARIRLIRGAHVGIAAARNSGFAATDPRSEFVTFFDHDDIWEKDALAELVSALDAHPECPAAHGVCRCIDSNGVQFPHDDHAENMRNRHAVVGDRVEALPLTAPTSFGAILLVNYVTTPGTSLIRRKAFEVAGGFEPSTVPCDDWDMNLRIARLGDFAFVDKILLNWRRHDQATSNLVSTRWRTAYLTTRRRTLRASDASVEQKEAARFALRRDIMNTQREAISQLRRGALTIGIKRFARALLLSSEYVRASVPARG